MEKAPEPLFVLREHEDSINALHVVGCGASSSGSASGEGVAADKSSLHGVGRGSLLLSADGAGFVYVWDLETRRKMAGSCVTHVKGGVLDVWANSAGTGASSLRAFVHCRDGTTAMYDINTELQPVAVRMSEQFSFCKFSVLDRDAPLVAIPKNTSEFEIHDFVGGQTTHSFPAPEDNCGGIMTLDAVNAPTGGFWVLSSYENGSVYLWDTRQPSVLASVKAFPESSLSSCSYSSNDGTIRTVLGSTEGNMVKLKGVPSKGSFKQESISLSKYGLADVNIRSDGKLIASTGWDGRLRITSLSKFKKLCDVPFHADGVYATAFGRDELGHVLAGGKDGRIGVWSLYPTSKK